MSDREFSDWKDLALADAGVDYVALQAAHDETYADLLAYREMFALALTEVRRLRKKVTQQEERIRSFMGTPDDES